MKQRDVRLLVLIIIVAAFAAWVAWPGNPGIHLRIGEKRIDREIKLHLGLDLQGGMQVLLEADLPPDQPVEPEAMEAARSIVENRVNGLGVTEPIVQAVGSRRILVELPGVKDPEAAIATLKETGLLEFVDTGTEYLPPGTVVRTDFETSAEASQEISPTGKIYHTVLTGRHLKSARVEFDRSGLPVIAFELDSEGAKVFAEHTAKNVDRFLAIVLDKKVISCPRIKSAIPEGRGQITGQFTVEEAKAMVLQLRYGALPIPLKVIDTRAVGPTLGQDSVQKSIRAGTIGLLVVLLFMFVYYRLPGFLADLALLIYAMLTLALFKLIPVTLTLPGIAGFLLSVGMAVDANILIFERMREELRRGRTLQQAIAYGFRRAWSSILDSNVSTWITCLILWFFGNSFGASVVKGFAVTLAIGVFVSMFTAVTVTRTFVHAAFAIGGEKLRERKWLLGI
ncbi:MAG: protein translocase subunit SecD [Anaerolineae bacterium]|nr:protein translocase subunit SecD [Anaerolineae bacterium]